MLLHGSLSASGAWRAVASDLANNHRVIAPDLWGYGKSAPWSDDWDPDIAWECELVEALAYDLEKPVHLAGHSHGGVVALAVAMRGDVDLQSLILIDATPFDFLRECGEDTLYAELRAVVDGYFTALETDEKVPVRRVIDYWDGPGAYDALPQGVQDYISAAMPMNVINIKTEFNFNPPREAYRALTVPTLVVHGGQTAASSKAMSKLLSETIPAARVSPIAGAGHSLISTHSQDVAAVFRRWTQVTG
ncbi:MAG: pimeloyl-ACP methyl ester carboxylesterase [Alphaproteobacteria bacterium]|jgi:pimeloyl-ACP methyl ester carboxylesterase